MYRFFHKVTILPAQVVQTEHNSQEVDLQESEAMELINQVAAEDKRMKMISYECKGALPERKPSGRDIADLNVRGRVLIS